MYLFSTQPYQEGTPIPAERPKKTLYNTPSPANLKPIGNRTFSLFGRHKFEPTPSKMTKSLELQETLDVFEHIKKSKSLKALQLAPIPHAKPLTMSSLLGEEVVPSESYSRVHNRAK